jgi:tRNA(Ile)-lysidine synthase
MHFFRGSGISGLRGILPKQGALVRPLLFARKSELFDFARARDLEWVEDSSNQSDKYHRNYFRNQLLPIIRNILPQAEENLADNLRRFRDIELLYQQAIQKHKKRLLEYKGAEVHIPVARLQLTTPLASVFYEIIKDYGFAATQIQEALDLLKAGTGKYIQSSTHRILKNRNWLIITPLPSIASSHILVEKEDALVDFEGGRLKFEMTGHPASIPADTTIACLDATNLKFPLLLRRYKAGDYFYPLGMRKKKKLARFFIDQKLSAVQKEKIWVLESDKKIIWVIGMRIDDRFKITTQTRKTLLVRLKALDI